MHCTDDNEACDGIEDIDIEDIDKGFTVTPLHSDASIMLKCVDKGGRQVLSELVRPMRQRSGAGRKLGHQGDLASGFDVACEPLQDPGPCATSFLKRLNEDADCSPADKTNLP